MLFRREARSFDEVQHTRRITFEDLARFQRCGAIDLSQRGIRLQLLARKATNVRKAEQPHRQPDTGYPDQHALHEELERRHFAEKTRLEHEDFGPPWGVG